MKTFLLLMLACSSAFAQGGGYASTMTWEPRNLKTKAGLVASYDPGNANTLVFNGSYVSAMSNCVTVGVADLLQATPLKQPFLTNNLGGRAVLYFDGAAFYMKTASFTLNQPEEVYTLFNPKTWGSSLYLFDGNTASALSMFQTGVSPNFSMNSGATLAVGSITLGQWSAVKNVFKSTSSFSQINASAPSALGDAGNNNASGFTLGDNAATTTHFFNGSVARILICNKTNAPAESNYLKWGLMKQAGLY